jgi:dihydrofolate reductase
MNTAKLAFVVAVSKNGVIGRAGRLPWRLPSDLKHFKKLTMGKPMLMGRRTWDSIGRPLPGRESIVITRDREFAAQGAHVAHSIEQGLQAAAVQAARLQADTIMIVGGSDIFAALLDRADIIHLTEVDLEPDGDVKFPPLDAAQWTQIACEVPPRAANDEANVRFLTYARSPERPMSSLTLAQASQIVDAALARGRELKLLPLTVVVLDAGGHMVALKREDGSGIARVEIATGKAWGGLGMGFGSRELFERWQKAPMFVMGYAAASGGRMMPVPGGVLIRDGSGEIIGAVGISGDTSDNDETCCVAGIGAAALKAQKGTE